MTTLLTLVFSFFAFLATGYAFLVYSMAASVEILISNCHLEDGSYYFPVSSQSQQNKKVRQ